MKDGESRQKGTENKGTAPESGAHHRTSQRTAGSPTQILPTEKRIWNVTFPSENKKVERCSLHPQHPIADADVRLYVLLPVFPILQLFA